MGCRQFSRLYRRRNEDLEKEYEVGTINSLETDDVFTKEQVQILKTTWPAIENNSRRFSEELFRKLFANMCHLLRFFKKMRDEHIGSVDWEAIATHGDQVMEVFSMVVQNLDDLSGTRLRLRFFGSRHALYDVESEYFTLMWPSLRDTLKSRMGNKFDNNVELAWKQLFDFTVYHMSRGIEEEPARGPKRHSSMFSTRSP